jgi:hypothetical protein
MNHQSDQLTSSEHHSPFVAMLAGFVKLFLEESGVLWITPLNREGCFAEVVTQVGVTGASERRFFGLEVSRGGLAPFEASELGDFVLVMIEAFSMTDLSDDASGEDRPEAGNGIQGMRNSLHGFGDGHIHPF